MKKFNDAPKVVGVGGWLALFQMRMVMGFIPLLVLGAGPVLAVLFVTVLALCMTLFYLRHLGFRSAYIVAATLGIVISVAALPIGLPYLIAQLVLDVVMIPALYRSKRVKDTFVVRKYALEACDRRYNGYDRNCYDVYLATYRCAR